METHRSPDVAQILMVECLAFVIHGKAPGFSISLEENQKEVSALQRSQVT